MIKKMLMKYLLWISVIFTTIWIIIKAILNFKRKTSSDAIVHDIEETIEKTKEKIQVIEKEQAESKTIIDDLKKQGKENDEKAKEFFKD